MHTQGKRMRDGGGPTHSLPHVSLTSLINREDLVLQLGGMCLGDAES